MVGVGSGGERIRGGVDNHQLVSTKGGKSLLQSEIQ